MQTLTRPLENPYPGISADQTKSKWHALVATFLGESFDAMDATIYFIALYPALSELLKTGDAVRIGWYGSLIMACFMIGWGAGSIVCGVVADRMGRVRTMMATVLIYALATGLCAIAQEWWHMAVCRFFVGLGIGGEISLGVVVLGEFWKGRGMVWAMSVMQTSFSVGVLLTGLFNLGSGQFGWRYLFLVGMLPAALTLYIRLKMSEPDSYMQMDRIRKELEKSEARFLNPHESCLRANPLKVALNRDNRRTTILVAILAASAIVGYWAGVSWTPAWINQLTGDNAVNARSLAMIWMSIGAIAGCLLTPFWIARLGYSGALKLGFAGSLLTSAGMFLLVHSYTPAVNAWTFSIGISAVVPFVVLCNYIPQVFATQMLATASGIAWGTGRFLAAFVGLCSGSMMAFFHGSYALTAACVTSVYLLGAVSAFWLREPLIANNPEDIPLAAGLKL